MSALVRAGAAASAAPRILAARQALPPALSVAAKAQHGGAGGGGGRGGGGSSSASPPPPLDLDALLADKGAVESMRAAIRGAMTAATPGGPPRRSGSREPRGEPRGELRGERGGGFEPRGERGGGERGERGGGGGGRDDNDRRGGGGDRDRRPASDRDSYRDRDRRGPPRDRDRRGGGGPPSRGGRWGGGRDGDEGGDPAAAAMRLSSTFRLDLQSTALGRAAAALLDDAGSSTLASRVCVAVLQANKTRLFDEQEAAAPSLVSTLAQAAARDAAAPAAAGASPMVFGGAVAFVARLRPDGRCSPDVAVGGAFMPKGAAGSGNRASSAQRRLAAGADADDSDEEEEEEEQDGSKEQDGGWPGPEAGDPVLVATPDGRALAWGAYNGASMFRVRVLQTEAEALADERAAASASASAADAIPSLALDVPRLLERRVREAADLRRALGMSVGPQPAPAGPPKRRRATKSASATGAGTGAAAAAAAAATPATDVFRLVNGEGDRLSGLVADQMGPGVVVVQSNAAWVERHREDVERALRRALAPPAAAAAAAPAPEDEEAPEEGRRRRRRTTKASSSAPAEQEGAVRVIWRRAERMLREEGVPLAAAAAADEDEDEDEQDAGEDGAAAAPAAAAPAAAADAIVAREAGILFVVAPESGQKTGFYADQRDNRAFVASLVAAEAASAAAASSGGQPSSSSSGPITNDVLDLCCYSGGFALSAARAGATRVDAVDSSASALQLARQNAALNGVGVFPSSDEQEEEEGPPAATPAPVLALHRADASAFLSDANARGAQWRVVVLDPPKLAPSRRDLERALRKYRHLNAAALRAVRPGGFLITHSCSGAVARAPALLQAIVCSAAASAGRQVTLVREGGAAPDHPLHAAYPEGRYLTSLCFRVL